MDLTQLSTKKAAEAGFTVTLRNPFNSEELPVRIKVLGSDSDAYQRLLAQQARRRTERLARSGRRAIPTEEELFAETVDRVVECTAGWDADKSITFNGKPLGEFSKEAARELFSNPDTRWVLEQVDEGIGNRANFSPSSGRS